MERKEKNDQSDCVVCYRHASIYSIGECDHPVCHECSTRMRVLCATNECPICRKDLSLVVFKRQICPFSTIRYQNMKCERRYNIYFETDAVMRAYDDLLEHRCQTCSPQQKFRNFLLLKDHVRKIHERYYCDLCSDHLKIFTHERRNYTRQQLAQHRRKGDEDDKSHRGHPLCEFCDKRFMDKDILFLHLRRDHYFCHFCDADGKHQFFDDYEALREHFKADHYLCEEGTCLEERFTSVFRTKLDLQAHRAQRHCQSASKSEARQARTVEIAFNVNRHPSHFAGRGRGGGGAPGRNTRSGRRDIQDFEEQEAAAAALPPSSQITKQQSVNINCVEDFPSLGGMGASGIGGDTEAGAASGSSNKSIAQKLAHQNRFTIRTAKGRALNEEDFPSLGPSSSGPANSSNYPNSNSASSAPINASLHFSVNAKKNNSLNTNNKENTMANVSIKYSCSKPTQMVPSEQSHVHPANVTTQREPKLKPQVGSISHSGNITFRNSSNSGKDKQFADEFPSLVPSVNGSSSNASWVVPQPSVPPPQQTTKGKKNVSETHKKDQVSKNPKEMFIEKDFPSLIPSSQSQKQMLNYSGRSSVTIPVKSTLTNSDQSKLNDSDENSAKNKKKKKALNKNNLSETKVPPNPPAQSLSTKPKKKSPANFIFHEPEESGPQEDLSWGRLGEYESSMPLQNSNVQFVKSDNSPNTKKSELQIGTLQAPKLNSKDFPSLGLGKLPETKENKTPSSAWGAPQSKTKKRSSAPSGIANKSRSSLTQFPDTNMTFTSSSGQKFSIPPSVNSNQNKLHAPSTEISNQVKMPSTPNFLLPPNFEHRNKELINTIQDVCEGNSEKFGKFKHLAEMFRSDEVSGHEYYKQCRQVIGKAVFHCILPELLALLPDIPKQQAVLEAYKKIDGGRGCSTQFAVCASCQQVLIPEDFSHHMDSCKC